MCTVLLVEDEWLIAAIVQQQLAEDGHEVVWAADASQALAVLEGRPEHVDALVTDVDLGPGPNGFELACRAREIRPGLPVVYATARAERQLAENGVSGATLLHKPYQLAALSHAVHRAAAQAEPERLAA
jgi:CheY-like chemotaxis protein